MRSASIKPVFDFANLEGDVRNRRSQLVSLHRVRRGARHTLSHCNLDHIQFADACAVTPQTGG
jgi:hypothetical protein